MPPRILIAEDDEIQSAVLRSALQSRGYQIDVAKGGLEAVRRLRTEHYDVALLDYNMPEIDGLGAARLLHDLMPDDERPRLIAVTALAEGLQEKGDSCLDASFDAIVSKRVGLPALFKVIESNLTVAAERQAVVLLAREQKQEQEAEVTRRRRRAATLALVPAVGMMGAFLAAIVWASLSLTGLSAALGSVRQADVLSNGTAAVIGTLQDAENSQRNYLASGAPADLARFEGDAQHVDQLLSSATPLSSAGAPGFDAADVPQAVIEPRLRTLAEEAQARAPGPVGLAASDGRPAADQLRSWAAGLVGGALDAVATGLGTAQHNVSLVLGVLGTGVMYTGWISVRMLQRRWRLSAATRVVARPEVTFHPYRPGAALVHQPPMLLTDS